MAVFTSIIVLGIIYRLRIHNVLITDTSFSISSTPLLILFTGMMNELIFAGCSLVIVWFLIGAIEHFTRRAFSSISQVILITSISVLLLGMATVYNASYHFWMSMNTGLTRDLIIEGMTSTSVGDTLQFLDIVDIITIVSVLGVFLFRSLRNNGILIRNRMVPFILSSAAIILFIYTLFVSRTVAGELADTPVRYTAESFLISAKSSDEQTKGDSTAAEQQMRSVRLIDPRFVSSIENHAAAVSGSIRKQWNLLFIILESTGREYVFNTSAGNLMPMPFLNELSKKSLFLDNHFSVGNTSPRSLFSLLSGLYPDHKTDMFCTRNDVALPSIASFMVNSHESFLVTPGSLDWFFPHGFMKNSGFGQLYGYDKVPARIIEKSYGKDEIETVDFFLKKLEETETKPFFAIYYSFVAHWPYIDSDEKTRIFPDTKSRLNRYYNNLHMMDTQIRRIFDYLNKAKLADNTIVVIVGDHGEAFNQHPGNWVHSRDSYNENYRVPALVYQPKLFKAKTLTIPTTHVDIMPTLFDAMGIPYNENLIQGESLLKQKLRRRYIFLYGNESVISSISTDGVKLQYSLKDKSNWAYDLSKDPGERKRLGTGNYGEQKDALLFFHSYQDRILVDYNEAAKKRSPFNGETHPETK
jgi:membrane-anchored protein YejM (alkaline phosphatase superfamily)